MREERPAELVLAYLSYGDACRNVPRKATNRCARRLQKETGSLPVGPGRQLDVPYPAAALPDAKVVAVSVDQELGLVEPANEPR